MVKKQVKREKEDMELLNKLSKIGTFPLSERVIQVYPTEAGTILIVDFEIYSLEFDNLQNRHYLLQLSHPNSVRIANLMEMKGKSTHPNS